MNNHYKLIQAKSQHENDIWKLIQEAILKRKFEGSTQWQDGYPNVKTIQNDIINNYGFIIIDSNLEILAYIALIFDKEPVYEELKLGWLTKNTPYLVIHRLAVSQNPKIKGLAFWILQQAEILALSKNINSIRVDTNFDNAPMLHLFKKLDYTYCGEVYFRGSARLAFEKILR